MASDEAVFRAYCGDAAHFVDLQRGGHQRIMVVDRACGEPDCGIARYTGSVCVR